MYRREKIGPKGGVWSQNSSIREISYLSQMLPGDRTPILWWKLDGVHSDCFCFLSVMMIPFRLNYIFSVLFANCIIMWSGTSNRINKKLLEAMEEFSKMTGLLKK